jgi:hypothetical protein
MRRVAVLVFAFLLACGDARAADQPVPQASQVTTNPADTSADDSKLDLQKPDGDMSNAAESWWQKVLRTAPNCKFFSDGCRTCSQTVCSNIGIACQPKEWSCNDANTDSKPEAKPDATSEPKP